MASTLALKKLVPSNLLSNSLRASRQAINRGYHHDRYLSDRDERKWDTRETEDSLSLHMDMPGLGKEDVKVVVEQHIDLIVKGEETKVQYRKQESVRKYTNRMYLSKQVYKTDQIKAEMKNGVLKVVVPKVKEEERSDFHVKIE